MNKFICADNEMAEEVRKELKAKKDKGGGVPSADLANADGSLTVNGIAYRNK